jgi:hypothetical protein
MVKAQSLLKSFAKGLVVADGLTRSRWMPTSVNSRSRTELTVGTWPPQMHLKLAFLVEFLELLSRRKRQP